MGLAYARGAGETLSLDVSAPHRQMQVLGAADGRPCPADSGVPGGPSGRLCRHLTFTPTYGPNGRRTIYALVTGAHGLPVGRVRIASVEVRFARPAASKPAISRSDGGVLISWAAVSHAVRYAVGIDLSDGRKLSVTTSRRSVRVSQVAAGTSVTATIWPILADGATAASASARLGAGSSATKPTKKPKPKPKPAPKPVTKPVMISIDGFPAVRGVYDVRPGVCYELVLASKVRPLYVDAAPAPVAPHGGVTPFYPDGSVDGTPRWYVYFTIGSRRDRFSNWDVGVQVGHRLYVVHIHLD